MFKKVPFARTKANSDIQPIASTSSPTIGNTLVGCSNFILTTLFLNLFIAIWSRYLVSKNLQWI